MFTFIIMVKLFLSCPGLTSVSEFTGCDTLSAITEIPEVNSELLNTLLLLVSESR